MTADDARARITRAIKAVTDTWVEPLDDVHDIPQIVNAVLAEMNDYEPISNKRQADFKRAVVFRDDARPGDIAEHINGQLDPREVVAIDDQLVWLRGVTDSPMGPFPRTNYHFFRYRPVE